MRDQFSSSLIGETGRTKGFNRKFFPVVQVHVCTIHSFRLLFRNVHNNSKHE